MLPENPLISFVIPVYEAEAFLDCCVESILAQTYENLEIILVDDGSPDASPQMCDAWAEKDTRIRVIHKPNGGQADARNQGILAARGDYLSFVDSDDYISPDYTAYLLGLLREYKADIACGQLRQVYDWETSFLNQPPEKVDRYDSEGACLALYGEHYMPFCTLTAKLLPRAVVAANLLPVGHLHEDEATTYKYFYTGGVTVVGTREIYAYYQNVRSINHNRTDKNRRALIQVGEEQFRYFERQGCRRLQLAAARRLLSDLIYHAAQGDEVSREFLKAGRAQPYFLPELDWKIRLRYQICKRLDVDISELLHRIKGS